MSAVAAPLETLPAFGPLTAFTRSQKWGKWTPVADRAFRALMDNQKAGENRLWAFSILKSWGNPNGPRKEAADENGRRLRQSDAARALDVSTQTIGRWIKILSAQNRLHYTDQTGLAPVADPSIPSETPEPEPEPEEVISWPAFNELYDLAFPDDAAQEATARDIIALQRAVQKRGKTRRLALYKVARNRAGLSLTSVTELRDLRADTGAGLSRMPVTKSSEPEPETLDFDFQTPSVLVPDSPPSSVPPSVTLSAPVLIDRREEIKKGKKLAGRLVAEVPTYLPENEPKNSFSEIHEPETLPETAEEIELLNVLDQTGLAVPPDDPILSEFVALATSHSIPVISLCRAIFDKCEQKAALGRRIFSAYALYDFLAKGDLRQWIAQHGREVEPEPEAETVARSHWNALLFAAKAILMDYTETQLPKIRADFEALPLEEQRAAIDGIQIRVAIRQYDEPKYIPQLARYVSEKLWTGVLRVSRGRSPALTDRKAAARQEFEKRLMEEMAENARREIHD